MMTSGRGIKTLTPSLSRRDLHSSHFRPQYITRILPIWVLPLPQIAGRIIFGQRQAEMPISAGGRHATARRALQITLLDEIRFQHIFDGVALFADGGGKIVHSYRP